MEKTINDLKTRNLFLGKSFLWCFIGLLITLVTGILTSATFNVEILPPAIAVIIFIVEMLIIFILPNLIFKFRPFVAMFIYIYFCILQGIMINFIFKLYNTSSIIMALGLTTGIMVVMSVVGFFTKIDLSEFRSLFIIGLFFCILAGLINLFLGNPFADIVIDCAVILLMMFSIADDVQEMKLQKYNDINAAYIYFALSLYLSFINIFIRLLGRNGKSLKSE